MEYNRQGGISRKPYSKLTAQFARNAVKKHLLTIRSGGARAADELLDQFLGSGKKTQVNDMSAKNISIFEIRFLPVIERNRAKWRNFIIELAGRFDPDFLADVGVGIVYGGIMTSSVGNIGWASEIALGDKNGDISADRIKKVSDLISSGRSRGNLVWIMKGKGVCSSEMLRIYRYYPECVFFLVEDTKNNEKVWENTDNKSFFGSKNIIFLLSEVFGHNDSLAALGIPYIIDRSLKGSTASLNGGFAAVKGYERELMSFFESPAFPLTVDNIADVADLVEGLLSEGKSQRVPRYTV